MSIILKIAIVDNVQDNVRLLETFLARFIKETALTYELSLFGNGEAFLPNHSDFDIVFINVNQKNVYGMEYAHRLRAVDNSIVIAFISDNPLHALDGYEVGASDIFLPPFPYEDFYKKMKRILSCVRSEPGDLIHIKAKSGFVRLFASAIYYVEVVKHTVTYYTLNGEITVSGTMKDAEKLLKDFNFFRVHCSYLINLKYVRAVKGNMVNIGGTDIKISRGKKQEFLDVYQTYCRRSAQFRKTD